MHKQHYKPEEVFCFVFYFGVNCPFKKLFVLIKNICRTLSYFDPAYLSVNDMPPLSQDWDYPGRVDTIREQIHFSHRTSASLEPDITCEGYFIRNISSCTLAKVRPDHKSHSQWSDGTYQFSASCTPSSTSSSSTESKADSSSCDSSLSQGSL